MPLHMGHMLCRSNYIEHVIPLPVETATLQFFGARATGEHMPWDYYLNMNSAVLNEVGITNLPPPPSVIIKDDSGCPCCEDDAPLSITDTNEEYSQDSLPARSQDSPHACSQ